MHDDETPEACIARELMEELDVNVTVLSTIHTLTYAYPDLTIDLIALRCRIRDGNITLHEHTNNQWASAPQLQSIDICDADRKILPHLLKLL